MNRLFSIAFALCIFIFFFPLIALSDDCPRATPIITGDVATCDGVILSEAKVKENLNLKAYAGALQEKLAVESSLRKREKQACREKLRSADQQISKLREFRKRQEPPWWQTAKFNRWLGFAGEVVVSVATIQVVK